MGFVIGIIIILILLLLSCVKIVPQAKSFVIERLGAYHVTWGVGLHFKAPMIDRVAKRVSLKEQVVDFPPQPVITKDNVTIDVYKRQVHNRVYLHSNVIRCDNRLRRKVHNLLLQTYALCNTVYHRCFKMQSYAPRHRIRAKTFYYKRFSLRYNFNA